MFNPKTTVTTLQTSWADDVTQPSTETHTEITYRFDPKQDRLTIGRGGIVLERGGYGDSERETLRIDAYSTGDAGPIVAQIASLISSLKASIKETSSDDWRAELETALAVIRSAVDG